TGAEPTATQRSRPASAPPAKGKALADDATVMAVPPELAEVMAKEAAVAEQWEVGDVILDLYEVKGALGAGGMGQVYRVRHMSWNADLAVKTPRPEIFSQEGVKEVFVSEAETWVNLGLHAHVVCCYYVRTLGGIPRVFVEYVEGGSLCDWIRDRRLYAGGESAALERILDISIQFAWGLRFAHQQGLVHRDVKPANVMMTAEGVAKVTDFGLARATGAVETDSGNSAAAENRLAGAGAMTPAYCSPEQAGGEAVSLKTDIWSWAVSVLEMFTGEVTWMAGQVAGAALEEHLENCAGDGLIPPMPARLAELLRRSLRTEPSERPADMDEVVEELRAIYREVAGRDYERPQPRAGRGTADSLNNRALSLLDLGKVKEAEAAWEAALAADLKHPETTFNYGVLRWRRGELTDAALVEQLESVRALHPEDWRIDYFFSLFHLERGDIRASLWFLEAASRKSPESVELQKALELARSGKISGNTPVRDLATRAGLLDACMLSSDGERMLTIGAGGVMRVWETASGDCLQTKENDGPVTFASLSGDGRLALTGDLGYAELWDSSTGEVLHTSQFESQDAANARWFTEPDPESRKGYLLRVLKTQLLLRVALPFFFVLLVSGLFGFLASLVIVLIFILAVRSYQKDKEQARERFMSQRAHMLFIHRACLSSDGRHVLTWNAHRGMNYETLKYWDTQTGECLYTLEENTGDQTTFGPRRGTGVMHERAGWVLRLMFGQGTFKTFSFWKWARPKTAAEAASALDMDSLRLPGAGQAGTVVAQFLSEDARHALTGSDDGRVRLYDLKGRRRRRTFAGHNGPVTAVCLSEDGRSVLSGSEDATVRLWDVASGRCLKTFSGHQDCVTSVRISRDARYALSGSRDGALRLWDAKTGCCVRVYAGHRGQVLSANLSCCGRSALSAGADARLLLWDIPQPNGDLFPAQMSRVRATAEVIEHEGRVRDLLERGVAAMQGAVFDDALALVERAKQTPGFERMRQNLE
ncbi:MAG TPA: protein kinase, partial [Pyrinomonadaceae bacterium]|nr:protein kinase [Pyrinomonadaceae bacterium]